MKTLLAAGLLVLLTAAGASADDQPGKKPGGGKAGGMMLAKLMEKADANKDGKISREEFMKSAESAPGGKLKQHAEQVFKRLDANDDGFITKDEIKKAQEMMQARRAAGGKPGAKKPG